MKESVTPTFPESALSEGLTEGGVTLKVLVGVDGKVQKAEVVESAGHGFDEAAEEAALGYVFEPAMVSGQAAAAYVLVRIDFQAPAEPPIAAQVVAAAVAPVPKAAIPAPEDARKAETEAEVTVQGHSEAEQLRRSAEAVVVVETKEAKLRSEDMGELLARTQGVAVQRQSGLGSETRVSMNGMTEDQIRFFLDGVPLEFMGYTFGIANVPVNVVDRIEIYRGVVPVRFGADALGGAINLVSEHRLEPGARAAASLQAGSFGTYRLTASGDYLDEPSGFFTRIGAFLDLADNDYPMDIEVPDDTGQEVPAHVYRFHDAYQALGANVEAGLVDQKWAKRFSVRGFITGRDKEIQHNPTMTFLPYGDVEYGQTTGGALARYENTFLGKLTLKAVAGYTHEHSTYDDLGECYYNWFGQCFAERPQPGERIGRAQEQEYWEQAAYGRVNAEWLVHPMHSLLVSLNPTYTTRTGEEHRMANPEARDPLSAEQRLAGLVTGIEYEAELFDRKLENQFFLKDYFQALRAEQPMTNGVDFRRMDRTTHQPGVGDSLRYAFVDWLYAKASYEWATRLPRADEIFGNAFPVQPNLELEPETSHNLNVGATVDSLSTSIGEFDADVNGFFRYTENLIRLVPTSTDSANYQNVNEARTLGIEGSLAWTSPGEYVALTGNTTYVDSRSVSTTGPDAAFEGDRIPNRPYFFATLSARLLKKHVAAPKDELSLGWTTRYVHSFFLGWESIGTDKKFVPDQFLHSLDLTYFVPGDPLDLSFSGELQNLTDAEAYDYFGVPKPGRAFYFKMTASY